MTSSRRTWLTGGAAAAAVAVLGRRASAQSAPKTYPLAAKSLVLDAAQAGEALVAVGDRGFILRSTDMGQTWVQGASPTEVMLTALAMPSPNVGIAVGHDATILRSTDGGVSWTVKSSAPDLESPLLDVWFESEIHGFAIGAYGLIYETRDGGETWDERRISEDEPHLYALAKAADGSLFVAGEAGALFHSTDMGATWTAVESSPYEGSYFGLMSLIDGALLAFGLRGNLFRSPDLGKSWEEIPTGTTASLMGGVQRKDGSIYIVGLSGTILTSIDGKSFQLTTLPEREALSGVIETAGQQMIVFGERGVRQLQLEKQP
ncbi:MAG: YCF48-related protein [Rhodospirillaceae bacterium]|nr:YCF48-related protein [Rhodospirillaceae bacterium]